ncbi:pseudouridine synthase [Nonomuraea sp. NPDC049141]|uniref:pseudouridine synthase n=1 Tax=Nonomuraea sp. NPDC049141 TaxID=3155500 RepID=UPI00340BAC35
MNNRRSTPSGDGRGRGRTGGASRGGRPAFRSDDSRGGPRREGFRGGSHRDDSRGGPRRDDSDRGGSRDSGSELGSGRDSLRADRGGSRARYGRPASGDTRDRSGSTGDRGGYDRTSSRDDRTPRDDRPSRDDRTSPRDDDRSAPRSDRGGYGTRPGNDRGGYTQSRGDRGGYGAQPRGERGYGASSRGEAGGYGSSSGGDRGGYRSDRTGSGPRDRSGSGPRDRAGSGPRDRSGSGPRERGARDSYRPQRSDDRGGFRSDRSDDRGGFRPERSDDRGGFRSDRGGFQSERRDDRGGFRTNRTDDRGGFRSDRSDDRGGFRPERSDERGGFRADRGGRREGGPRSEPTRTGYGRGESTRARFGRRDDAGSRREDGRPSRTPRRDDVQTIGGRTSGRRDGAGSGAPRDRFKTARQPMRDRNFYPEGYTDERDTTEVPGGVRLQKVLAQAGVASRRACEEMIGDGRVTVNGQVVRRFGAKVDPAAQVIHVDGKRIPTAPDLVYYALNKPIGVVSTMDDPQGRPCLADYVQELAPRLFHVGRLDTETEGLLLLTNDGELANRLTHPSYGVQKKYWAKVPGPIPRDLSRRLKQGIELEDGIAKADSFAIVQEHGQQALVEIVLHEGRNHVVRRMLEEAGHRVIDLARIEFGPVKLGRTKAGTVRALSLHEVGELYAAVKL